ncbi:sensory box histidine kinase [Oceanicola granulosus HTCC2516]|uniref:Sensory box histidine kinase n=1 Tax=Oceanicola granulosus (strain ATCC BAA-861 / DSM 15982 / KCTC 12143 / HTCC2516) TaxID=314256 RepID=Q2CIF5_OCEGH|nr:PAS domain-containing protein [Oceanicola granulosus]EAR52303.1 sensory box histidine kinase [Oceanicola granulosus HTCC2516]
MDRKTSPPPGDLSDADAVAIFSASQVAMVLTNPQLDDNPIVYVNRAFEELTGYVSHMAVGRNCRFLQGEKTRKADVARLREAVATGEDVSLEILNYRANGEPFTNALLISPILDSETGEATLFLGLQREIDGESRHSQSHQLDELVTEIQHRVKNHLSMVIGLIRMQARDAVDGDAFQNIARRVESLQLLYEEMVASRTRTNGDEIQLGAYLGRVANAIAHLDGRPGVRMNIDVPPLMMETEKAVQIGLIVSEVLTNAMQHAFADQQTGLVELMVFQTNDGGVRAIISDDGQGIPEDVAWPGKKSLGGRLVGGLCAGLGASLHVARGKVGTTITLDVPNAR